MNATAAKPKKPFNFELFKICMRDLTQMSDNAMEPWVRAKIVAVLDAEPTPRQLFDLMKEISELQCDRFEVNGKKMCVGVIDGFTQKLCCVEQFYERPDA